MVKCVLLYLLLSTTMCGVINCFEISPQYSEFGLLSNYFDETLLPDETYSYYRHYEGELKLSFENCSMPLLSNSLMNAVSEDISSLNITFSSLVDIEKNAFRNARKLQQLNLHGNLLTELRLNTFIGAEDLKSVDLSHNLLTNVNMAFINLENLTLLKLQKNNLTSVTSAFQGLTSLRSLDLSENSIEAIETDAFKDCTSLASLNLNNNHLKAFDVNFMNNLHSLDLSYNEIDDIEKQIDVEILKINNNKNLSKLKINGIMTTLIASSCDLKILTIANTCNLEIADVNNNALTNISVFKDCSNLKQIDYAGNQFGDITVEVFSKMLSIQILDLGNCGMSFLPLGIFSHNSQLLTLDLSYNNFSAIDLSGFLALKRLKNLYINGNKLKSLDTEKIDSIFPALKEIDVSHNNWNCKELTKIIHDLNRFKVEIRLADTSKVTGRANIVGVGCYGETTADDTSFLANFTTSHSKDVEENLKSLLSDVKTNVELLIKKSENSVDQSLQDNEHKMNEMLKNVSNELVDMKVKLLHLELNQSNITNNHSIDDVMAQVNSIISLKVAQGLVAMDDKLVRIQKRLDNLPVNNEVHEQKPQTSTQGAANSHNTEDIKIVKVMFIICFVCAGIYVVFKFILPRIQGRTTISRRRNPATSSSVTINTHLEEGL